MKESCGVIAVSRLDECNDDVSGEIIGGLHLLQHRGQLSAGVTTFSPTRNPQLITSKGMGLVREVFGDGLTGHLGGSAGIGHVRYATSGGDNLREAQPFQFNAGIEAALAFNGNIANFRDLVRRYALDGTIIDPHIDTALIQQVVTDHLAEGEFMDSPHALARTLDGAYSLVMINEQGEILAYRDHHGFKPLCFAVSDERVLVASESVALNSYGTRIETLPPGCALWYSPKEGVARINRIQHPKPSRCFFEFVYFAREESVIDDHSVEESRINMGKLLAETESVDIDGDCVAISVPSSANRACEGFSKALGIKLKEGLKKRKNAGRTFIEAKDRHEKVRKKFEIDPDAFDGKKVFLVDDSLVRSTTVRVLIQEIKRVSSPKEIHLRIACPPISSPCFYGIDIPNASELFANGFTEPSEEDLPEAVLEHMARELGIDSIRFLSSKAVIQTVGGETRDLCLACVSGTYPTPAGVDRYAESKMAAGSSEIELSTPSALEKSCNAESAVGMA